MSGEHADGSVVVTGSLYLRLRNARNGVVQRLKRIVQVMPSAYVHPTARVSVDLRLGEYAFVGPRCELDPGVEIGRYSMLAPHVAIVGDDHVADVPGVPIQFSGRPPQTRTVIQDDVWVGYGAVVMRGITIGRGAIVAAHAVVTKDVAPYAVVAGVPARSIGERFPDSVDRARHDQVLDGPLVPPRFTGPLGAAH